MCNWYAGFHTEEEHTCVCNWYAGFHTEEEHTCVCNWYAGFIQRRNIHVCVTGMQVSYRGGTYMCV